MKKLFSPGPWWREEGLFLVRIITGFFITFHGYEIFDAVKMKEYISWDTFQASPVMPYIGKAGELAGGVLLLLGLFTRVGSLIIIGTFGYITFFVGHGIFWMEDQHPFLFVLLALVFFFVGAGRYSVDRLIFSNSKKQV